MNRALKRLALSLCLLSAGLLTVPAHASKRGGKMAAKDLTDSIRAQVKAALPADLLIDKVVLPPTFTVPEGAVVEVTWRKSPTEGNAWILVSASLDAQVKRRAFVRVELVAIRDVLVAQRPLAKGETLQAGDLKLEPRVGVRGIALLPRSLMGAPVLAAVEVGEVVTAATIGLPAPISRGTAIQVISRAGSVQVSVQARLETTARPGEMASARITRTRTMVRGRLVDEHTLIVALGSAQ